MTDGGQRLPPQGNEPEPTGYQPMDAAESGLFAPVDEGTAAAGEGTEPDSPPGQHEPGSTDEGAEAPPSTPTADGAWDGNPANLPPELQETHRLMRQGFNESMRELASLKNEVREKMDALGPEATPPAIDDSSDEAYDATMSERMGYEVKNSPEFKQMAAQLEAVSNQNAVLMGQVMTMGLSQNPKHSPAVEARMQQIVESNPTLWRPHITTQNGLRELQERAIHALESERKTATQADRASTAHERAVTPPGEGAPGEVTPSTTFARSFSELAAEEAKRLGLDL